VGSWRFAYGKHRLRVSRILALEILQSGFFIAHYPKFTQRVAQHATILIQDSDMKVPSAQLSCMFFLNFQWFPSASLGK
jgi:hypothetical protein